MTDLLTRIAPSRPTTVTARRRVVRRPRFTVRRTPAPAAAQQQRPQEPVDNGWLRGAVAAAVTTLATFAWCPLLDQSLSWSVPLCAAVTAVLCSVALWCGRRAAGLNWVTLPLGGVVGSVAVTVCARSRPGADAVWYQWFGVGWRDLFAVSLPAQATAPVLAAVLLGAAVATGLAAGLAATPQQRLLPLLPAGAVLLIGAWLTQPQPVVLAGVAFAAALHLRQTRPGSKSLAGTLIAGLIAALAVSGGLLAGALAPTRDAPRSSAPVQADPVLSPLNLVSAWRREPNRPVADIAPPHPGSEPGSELVSEPVWTWATLENYTGQGWRANTTFLAAPSGSPSSQRPDATARTVRTVRLARTADAAELPGPWLPRPGTAAQPSTPLSTGLLSDPATGDLASANPPSQYRVASHGLRPRTPQQLRTVTVAPAATGHGELHDLALRVTGSAATDYDRMLALQAWARSLDHDPGATPGQSISTLTEIAAGRRPATMDQVVGLYAVLARELGYRSRVVVGFTVTDATVGSRDIVAWPEVDLDGWQPFYPVALPGVATTDDLIRTANTGGTNPGGPANPSVPADRPATPPPATPTPATDSSEPLALFARVGVVAVALALVAAVLWWRRRRSISPPDQVLRAWAAVRRRLRRAGVEGVDAMTNRQLVQAVSDHLGTVRAGQAEQLAALVDDILFGAPERSAAIDQAVATRAGKYAETICSRRNRTRNR